MKRWKAKLLTAAVWTILILLAIIAIVVMALAVPR